MPKKDQRLAIVIPLGAKVNSVDWEKTSEALQLTLKSVIAQTSNKYRCIVVGHDDPAFSIESYNDDGVEFHKITAPEPICFMNFEEQREKQKAIDADKNMKSRIGIDLLLNSNVAFSHWFALDADDLIAKDFVEVSLAHEIKHGAILTRGYQYNINANTVRLRNNFHVYCGSSSILADCHVSPYKDDTSKIPWFSYSHMNIEQFFRETQKLCIILKKPIVCYVNHEDNSSRHHCNHTRKRIFRNALSKIKTSYKTSKVSSYFREQFLSEISDQCVS